MSEPWFPILTLLVLYKPLQVQYAYSGSQAGGTAGRPTRAMPVPQGSAGPRGSRSATKPPSEPPRSTLQAWPPPCLVTDRGFPGGRGLQPPFTGNVRSSCPLWTSSQLKLMFLLKFTNYPPVQVVTSTLLCVCTAVVTPALGFLTEMSLPQGHPALVALGTLPEPDHLLRHLKLMAPGVCHQPTEPPHNHRETRHTYCRGPRSIPGEERAPIIRPGSCVRFLPPASISMSVPLWPVRTHLAPLSRVPESMQIVT